MRRKALPHILPFKKLARLGPAATCTYSRTHVHKTTLFHRHLPAGLGALPARLGTDPAMVVMGRMLLAFRRAGVTCIGTGGAHHIRQRPTARHHADRGVACIRAVAIKSDARGHHASVFFIQAFIRAHFTCDEACDAGFDAFVILRSGAL